MKITELLMVGDPIRPANLSEETLKRLKEQPGEYMMVKDKDGNVRVVKIAQ